MEVEHATFVEQIENAKKGKQTAYKYLLDRFWNHVYGFQLKRVRNEYEAEEVTIETFSKAFDKLETFDNDFTFTTWLTAISKNIQIDRYRKKNAQLYVQMDDLSQEKLKTIVDTNPTPEDILIKKQNLAQLLRYIKKLKPHYQEVINLFYFQELSYAEISTAIDEPLSNVKVRLLRARKLLAEIITKQP